MPKEDRLPLASLALSDGERHAEFKRRRDEFVYTKVPMGGEAPYLNDGWIVEKKVEAAVASLKS
jgi:hypothetical protein